MMTVVPPAVGPELGETLVTTGEDGGAMFALKPAEVDWFVESVTFTENGNVPDWEGVPEICPVDA